MSVVVIDPPAQIVSLELAKKHLRVEDNDSDDLITAYIAAAQASIDGPEGWLKRAIGVQTLELRQDSFYPEHWQYRGRYVWDYVASGFWNWDNWPLSRIQLPFPPLISVVSLTYEDQNGADQVLTSTGWQGTDEGLDPAFNTIWPQGRVAANAVRIRYTAGYATPPAPIVTAILLMVGGLWGAREDVVVDASRVTMIENPTAEKLLAPYRVRSF